MNRYILYLDALGKRPRDESDNVTETSDKSNDTTKAPFEIWAKDGPLNFTKLPGHGRQGYDPDVIQVLPNKMDLNFMLDKTQQQHFIMQNQFGEKGTYFFIKNNTEHDVKLRAEYFVTKEGTNEELFDEYEFDLIEATPDEMEPVALALSIKDEDENCGYYLYDHEEKDRRKYVVKITLTH